jgi:hypothetical protein
MESGREAGSLGLEDSPSALRTQKARKPYSPSSPSSDAGEEPMDTTDWTANLPGIQRLLDEPGGQLPEGPASAAQAPGSGEGAEQPPAATPPPLTTTTLVSKPVPNPVPPPVVPATGSTEREKGEVASPRAAASNKPSCDPDVIAKARDFIKASREKKAKAITDSLGEDYLAYTVIKKANANKHKLMDLKTGNFSKLPELGSMITQLDGRMCLADVHVVLGQNQTWTHSFMVRTMECIGCTAHLNYTPFPRRGSNVRGGRQLVWLTDQSMPPLLPATTQQECIKIMRLESGTLQELAEGLVRTLSGRQIAAGSAVLMTSATNMAAAGPSGYAEDLMRAIHYLKKSMGDHVLYGPLPNIFMNGCGDATVIRTSVEVAHWARAVFKESPAMLSNSFKVVEKQLVERARGEMQVGHRYTLRMPTLEIKLLPYTSGGWDSLPTTISECSIANEKEMVEAIIEEAREKLAIDLDPHPTVDRWPPTDGFRPGGGTTKSFLIIGSSHAGKLGSALRKAGHHADVIYESNWRAVKANVTEMAERVREKLERTRMDTVVFCILDNSVYYCMDDNGDLIPPQRDKAGKFHIHGELVLSSRSAQQVLFGSIQELLDAAKGRNIIVLSPLPRYVSGGCCDNDGHVANRRRPGFEANLNRELKDVAERLRDYLFTTGQKLIKVLDPAVSWRGKNKEQLWGDDVVHPKEEAYKLMAEGVISINIGMESGAKKRARTNSIETGFAGPGTTLNRYQGHRGGGHGSAHRGEPSKRGNFGGQRGGKRRGH